MPRYFLRGAELESSFALILFYSPLVILSALSLLWLKSSGKAIKERFKWRRFSSSFLIGLAVSAGYLLSN